MKWAKLEKEEKEEIIEKFRKNAIKKQKNAKTVGQIQKKCQKAL